MDDYINILSVKSLNLTNFRNYKKLFLEFPTKPVIITGINGSGKTNILEAISFLSPGRGIRGAKVSDIDYKKLDNEANLWHINSEIITTYGNQNISTYRTVNNSQKRIIKIDDQIAKTQGAMNEIFSVIWLTPQMDQLFITSSTNRRKFLDRLVYNFDSEHSGRVLKYENLMRQRMKLLKEKSDPVWLTTIEHKMAEFAIAIASARVQTIDYLQKIIDNRNSPFPKAKIFIKGELESKINDVPSVIIEEEFKERILSSRRLDSQTNRTSIGVHLSDLQVYHEKKNIEAKLCSTGEQKLMLITILLAQARSRMNLYGSVPVLLLDEIAAHLDEYKRESLFEEIIELKSQTFITGTDVGIFKSLNKKAEFIKTETLINN